MVSDVVMRSLDSLTRMGNVKIEACELACVDWLVSLGVDYVMPEGWLTRGGQKKRH